jgi:hypothetical protein
MFAKFKEQQKKEAAARVVAEERAREALMKAQEEREEAMAALFEAAGKPFQQDSSVLVDASTLRYHFRKWGPSDVYMGKHWTARVEKLNDTLRRVTLSL